MKSSIRHILQDILWVYCRSRTSRYICKHIRMLDTLVTFLPFQAISMSKYFYSYAFVNVIITTNIFENQSCNVLLEIRRPSVTSLYFGWSLFAQLTAATYRWCLKVFVLSDVAVQISVFFQKFCKNYCCKTTKATTMKKVPNDNKLIRVINILIVVFCCLLFCFCTNRVNTKKFKCHYFDDVKVIVNGKQSF